MPPADPDDARRALLPAGLRDTLPPDAQHQARLIAEVMALFGAHGYDRVDPPLVEFEDSLLGGGDSGIAAQTFRMMDPLSQRMMGVRADMTIQIARIGTTRLGGHARPLRLSYAGDVLRVKGSQLRPERQFAQVGVELMGSAAIEAEIEVIQLAAETLDTLGVAGASVDLNAPPLVPALFAAYGLRGRQAMLTRAALDRKDADAVAQAAGPAAAALSGLLSATGPARAALMILTTLDLPEAAQPQRARLCQVLGALMERWPDLRLTVDPVENRGFEYYTGVGFALFAEGVRGELGRGGRYLAGDPGRHEPAVGFTLFMDAVLRALPEPTPTRRVFLPPGTAAEAGRRLRAQGWVTVAGLEPVPDAPAEARRLGCSHAWIEDQIRIVPS